MTTDPRIEAVAEVLYVQNVDSDDSGPFEFFTERKKNHYRNKAAGAIAAADAVDPLRQPGHRVEIAEDSWTLQHPPECRTDMLACPLNDAMRSMGINGVPEGVYAVELTEDGSLFFPDEEDQ